MTVLYKDQIVDMESLIILAEMEDGLWKNQGRLYFPFSFNHNDGILFYRSAPWITTSFDFACKSMDTLKDHLGLDLILYDAHLYNERSNKAALLQALCESYAHLNHTAYIDLRTIISQLPFYTLDEDNLEE
ncbi:MAG: hypothetical protein ACO3UU_09765 [Minisyncoccia bacterium]